MARTSVELGFDGSDYINGIRQATTETERYENSLENVAQRAWELERDSQRNMPGFNPTAPTNGTPAIHNTFEANENLRAYNDLGLRIDELKNAIVKANALQKEALEDGDLQKAFFASSSINQMEQEKARLEMQKKRDETESRKFLNSLKNGGIANYAVKAIDAGGQIFNVGSNYRASMANGDYLGAGLNRADGYANVAQGIGGSLLGAGAMLGWNPVGWGLMAAGGVLEAGGIVTKAITGKERADDAEASAYEKSLARLNSLNKLYTNGGDISRHSVQTDEIRQSVLRYAKDTGMASGDFLEAATRQSVYGTKSMADAMQQARQAALWANATGADLGSIQDFIGTASRYGINADTGYLSQARGAMGLEKAQTQEFLNALQGVIEDGISNGYIKSTEDVTKTFTMFARLSNNNPLWVGEQGARRLQSLNAGIAGATALQDVSQIMTVGVAKDLVNGMTNEQWNEAFKGYDRSGTYIDYMLMTEKGLTPQMFAGIGKSINSFEGDNYAGRIERWKQISGLNYAGAVALDQMYRNATPEQLRDDEWITNKINSMQKDKNYISEETKRANLINDLDSYVQIVGKSKYWDNLNDLAKKGTEYYSKALTAIKESNDKQNEEARINSMNESELHDEYKARAGDSWDGSSTALALMRQKADPIAADFIKNRQFGAAASEYFKWGKALWEDEGQFHLYSPTYKNLAYSDKGNESLDAETLNLFGEYAVNAEKKNWLGWTTHKADGVISYNEILDFMNRADSNKKLKEYYERGDHDNYIEELKKMLKELFGELIIESHS